MPDDLPVVPDVPPDHDQADWDHVNPALWNGPPFCSPELLGRCFSRGGEWVELLTRPGTPKPDPERRAEIAQAVAAHRGGLPWQYLADQVLNQSLALSRPLSEYLEHLKTIDKTWLHNARGAGSRGRGEELVGKIEKGLADGTIEDAQLRHARAHPYSGKTDELSEKLACDVRTLRKILKNFGDKN
jgi:hypothetical protein